MQAIKGLKCCSTTKIFFLRFLLLSGQGIGDGDRGSQAKLVGTSIFVLRF